MIDNQPIQPIPNTVLAHKHNGVDSPRIKIQDILGNQQLNIQDLVVRGTITLPDGLGDEALIYVNTNADIEIEGAGLKVNGRVECDSLEIDQTPSAGTIIPDKTIIISCNGVNYKIAVKAA